MGQGDGAGFLVPALDADAIVVKPDFTIYLGLAA
jgi:hypothetical protein